MKFVETIKLGLHHTENGHPTSEGKEYKNRRYDNSKKLTSKEARLYNVGIFNQNLVLDVLLKSCPSGSTVYTSLIYTHLTLECRKGDGNPLQYFCLENPMDGGAW